MKPQDNFEKYFSILTGLHLKNLTKRGWEFSIEGPGGGPEGFKLDPNKKPRDTGKGKPKAWLPQPTLTTKITTPEGESFLVEIGSPEETSKLLFDIEWDYNLHKKLPHIINKPNRFHSIKNSKNKGFFV